MSSQDMKTIADSFIADFACGIMSPADAVARYKKHVPVAIGCAPCQANNLRA